MEGNIVTESRDQDINIFGVQLFEISQEKTIRCSLMQGLSIVGFTFFPLMVVSSSSVGNFFRKHPRFQRRWQTWFLNTVGRIF